MAKTIYHATCPDGYTVTRTTETRTYTHAVVCTHHNSQPESTKYGQLGFCGSLALAEKSANTHRSQGYVNVAIVPAVEVTK